MLIFTNYIANSKVNVNFLMYLIVNNLDTNQEIF